MREWRTLGRWAGGTLAALGLIGGTVLISDGRAMAVLGINGTVGAPSSTVAGAVVTFSGEVSNTGTGASEDFTHVTIVDDGSLGLSNITSLGTGSVPAGVSSLPFAVTATITGPPTMQAQLRLKVTGVTASPTDVDPQADIDGSAFVISLAPTLTTQINVTGTEPGVLGETILGDTATLTGYAGSVAGETVTFHLYGPFAEGVTPVCVGTPVFTTTGVLNASGVAPTSLLFEPTAEGTYTWQASFPGSAINSPATHTCNQLSETITVVAPQGPDIMVSKADSPDPVNPGGNLTYTITATNNGPGTPTTMQVQDCIPLGTTFVSASGGIPVVSDPVVGASTGCVEHAFPGAAPGGSVTMTFVVEVYPGTPDNTVITNVATATSSGELGDDPNPSNNTDAELTTVIAPPPTTTSSTSTSTSSTSTSTSSTSTTTTTAPTTTSSTSSTSSTSTTTSSTSTTTSSTSTTSTEPASTTTTSTVPGGPSAVVDLNVIARGQIQTGHGGGFQAGETVTGEQRSIPLGLGTQTADANGEVTFTWTIRSTETLGDHTFVVTGAQSGSASAAFRVIGSESLPATGNDHNELIMGALAAIAIGGALALLTANRRSSTRR